MKTEVMSIKGFMSEQRRKDAAIEELRKYGTVIQTGAGSFAFMIQQTAMAADTFGNVNNALMNAFDAGVVLVIIFAGACWCLGHRSKALEILIGVCCGYILARHAIDIRNFLKTI